MTEEPVQPVKKALRVGVLTFPLGMSGTTPLGNMITILNAIADGVCVVTGGRGTEAARRHSEVSVVDIRHVHSVSPVSQAIFFAITQLFMAGNVIRLRHAVDKWIFITGGETAAPSAMAAKITGKPVFVMITGSPILGQIALQRTLSAHFMSILSHLGISLAHRVIVYTHTISAEQRFGAHSEKVLVAHHHYIDPDVFNCTTRFNERKCTVGYVGSISAVKGLVNLVKAFKRLGDSIPGLELVIFGGGELEDWARAELANSIADGRTRFHSWVPRSEIPQILNEIRVLVLPSTSEGLPNIIVEAMSCGAIVVAAKAGSVPDIIKDGETGFLLDDISPESIEISIRRALSCMDAERVTSSAKRLMVNEYSYNEVVNRWKEILTD